MNETATEYGRTIQLFLVDGSPSGLMIATLHGWTGALTVCRQLSFDKLLKRPELDRTGVYILYGPDPDNPLQSRAYIGEADCVRDRINQSAGNHAFWETAVAITTSDDALTKGHVRYLEARIIQMANQSGRATLANSQQPDSDKRRLPEADKANMEGFLANLTTILPVVGLDLLKPQPTLERPKQPRETMIAHPDLADLIFEMFEIRHKSGVRAKAYEDNGEFVVVENSEALKDTGYVQQSYGELKSDLIKVGVLVVGSLPDRYVFARSFAFKSPSAAAAIVLDRNSNGRTEWKVEGKKQTYHDWQAEKSHRKGESDGRS